MKKKYKIILVIIFIFLLGASGLAAYKYFSTKDNKTPITVNLLDTISEYGYSIDDRDSDYYKDEYNVLKDLLTSDKINEEEYAKQVAKLFVIDLYSIKTKVNKYDIGGLEYFYSTKTDMYKQKVMDQLYELVKDDSYGDRKQELPLVTNVEIINSTKDTYLKDDDEVDCYNIKLSITYETDLGYDKEAMVTITKDGIKQSVVELKTSFES